MPENFSGNSSEGADVVSALATVHPVTDFLHTLDTKLDSITSFCQSINLQLALKVDAEEIRKLERRVDLLTNRLWIMAIVFASTEIVLYWVVKGGHH